MKKLKFIAYVSIVVILTAACGLRNGTTPSASPLSDDQKHRLYSAALAASESPLETDTFKEVCRQIGIFDANGKPNDQYMAFVSRHVDWSMQSESDEFRREIDSKEKARQYIEKHFSAR
jgi:hypothetical protein